MKVKLSAVRLARTCPMPQTTSEEKPLNPEATNKWRRCKDYLQHVSPSWIPAEHVYKQLQDASYLVRLPPRRSLWPCRKNPARFACCTPYDLLPSDFSSALSIVALLTGHLANYSARARPLSTHSTTPSGTSAYKTRPPWD